MHDSTSSVPKVDDRFQKCSLLGLPFDPALPTNCLLAHRPFAQSQKNEAKVRVQLHLHHRLRPLTFRGPAVDSPPDPTSVQGRDDRAPAPVPETCRARNTANSRAPREAVPSKPLCHPETLRRHPRCPQCRRGLRCTRTDKGCVQSVHAVAGCCAVRGCGSEPSLREQNKG